MTHVSQGDHYVKPTHEPLLAVAKTRRPQRRHKDMCVVDGHNFAVDTGKSCFVSTGASRNDTPSASQVVN